MAGLYPDPPSWRIPYDLDGTQLASFDGNGHYLGDYTSLLPSINNEYSGFQFTSSTYQLNYWSVLFPEKMDLDAVHLSYFRTGNANSPQTLYYSTNTTNGWDGTWVSTGKGWGNNWTKDYARTAQSLGLTNVTGLRYLMSGYGGGYNDLAGYKMFLFGERTAGEVGKFLLCWNPTLDERVSYLDFEYGDVPRTSTNDLTFRVKNDSAYTANSVVVTTTALYEASPSIAGQFAVSTNGTQFYAQVNIGNLSPGAISSVLTIRRSLASNAALGLWWPRIKMTAGSWS